MAPEPHEDPDRPGGPDPSPETTPRRRPRPRIDVTPALHEAGHEVVDLGFEGVPDTGPVVHPERGHAGPDDPLDFVNVQMPSD